MRWNVRYAADSSAEAIRMLRAVIPGIHSAWLGMRSYEGQNEQRDAERHAGMSAVYNQLIGGLLRNGVKTIDAHGRPFDPNIHNALETLCTDSGCQREHHVEILTPGFAMGNKLIEPANVRVFH